MKVNWPKQLIASNQTAARFGLANKTINVSVFDQVNVKLFFVKNDGKRNPKYSDNINHATNDYL